MIPTASSSSRYRSSSPGPRQPKNSTAGASTRPLRSISARSCKNARNGAMPVPAAIITTGVVGAASLGDGGGGRKPTAPGRTDTCTFWPGSNVAR
ncbi:uncharacterized protein PgNI_09178 [Pyricularia grisea]|uniref:Uncharacterized protein n=1 Tax=Pyricularia grisea TaxID=148305 RepID=A0A6P8ASX8_PYRGI|nr:uncharacterized protein PgNI_09178 [Pyricularia grisea]TLD05202.1 hypothetical protein PgNI_09178 [Pyricularia grisea]